MASFPYLWLVVALVVVFGSQLCARAVCVWLGGCFALCWMPQLYEVQTTGYLRELVETGVAFAFAVDFAVQFACWVHGECFN